MAYMSTDQAADIRARLKEEFPAKEGWKLSVKKSSGSLGIDVAFVAGPHTFRAFKTDPESPFQILPETEPQTRASVNHYYIKEHWHPESAAILERARKVIMRDHWDKSDIQSDYFHCAFYVDLSVGRWDAPYTAREAAAASA